jgi:hypothetical protein
MAMDLPAPVSPVIRHAAVEVDLKLTNNGKVADGQLCQHNCFPV